MRKLMVILAAAAVILGLYGGVRWLDRRWHPGRYGIEETEKGPMDPLILVSAEHPYTLKKPSDLVNIGDVGPNLLLSRADMQGCREAVKALAEMNDAMMADGLEPMRVTSAYRSVSYQEGLFQNKIQRVMAAGTTDPEEAEALAAREVARPGTSEHHTGLAFDLTGPDGRLESFEQTPVAGWMAAHAYEFGFIKRYPGEKAPLTGIIDEPWHFRYVGTEAAKAIFEQGICLEEYVQEQ